jgi:NOL1/NOP2/fmu family ribosome biogenesis protein
MGHFAARIVAGNSPRAGTVRRRPPPHVRSRRGYPHEEVAVVNDVVAGVAPHLLDADSRLLVRGTNAYLAPPGVSDSPLARALVPGLHVVEKRGTTWRPAHALAKALSSVTAARAVNLSDEAAASFLSGRPSPCVVDDGLALALWQDLPLGWGRQRQGVLASLLPSGLRLVGEVRLEW